MQQSLENSDEVPIKPGYFTLNLLRLVKSSFQPGYFILVRREAPQILMQTRKVMDCNDGCKFHTAGGAIQS